LESTTARPLKGTDGARYPFWSDDGRALGFFATSQLKTIDIRTGAVAVLAPIVSPGGGAWHGDTIVYSPNSGSGGLFSISSHGGTATPATALTAPAAIAHRHPAFLPDGRHFLYYEVRTDQIMVGDLNGTPPVVITRADGSAIYFGGRLLFVNQGALVAQRFDASSFRLGGEPSVVVEQVAVTDIGRAAAAASISGTLAYRSGSSVPRRQYVWYDRTGKEIERVGNPEVNQTNPELSADGRSVVMQRYVGNNTDIWRLDLLRGAFNRITFDPSIEALPVWSPSGDRIAFNSNRTESSNAAAIVPGNANLYVMAVDGSAPARLIVESPEPKWASDWSPDGRYLMYRSLDQANGGHDLWVVDLDGGKAPTRIVGGPSDERDAQFSPDGRWIAFQSDESGRFEIYLQRFPGPGGKERVSTGGGRQVRWRRDGKELYYVTPLNEIASVSVDLSGSAVALKRPTVLFATRMVPGGEGIAKQQYMVSSDGQRFLINSNEAVAEADPPITILLNWNEMTPGRD
jgi:Tol biopolymer transport system component